MLWVFQKARTDVDKRKTVCFPGKYRAPWGPRFFRAMSLGPRMYRNKRLGCQMGCAGTKILAASDCINPLKPELNPICYLLALLGTHHFLHVSRIRVKLLTFGLLMSYIYMEHPFLLFLDHTQRRSTVGRTPLDE